jgi:hypothetical protein
MTQHEFARRVAVTRRDFVAHSMSVAFMGGAFDATAHLLQQTSPATPHLRVGLLALNADQDRHRGALLGIEEAEHAATMFGGSATLVSIKSVSSDLTGVTAVLSDDVEAHSRTLAAASNALRDDACLVMNVACTSDALRADSCSTNLYHVCPSDSMIRDAAAQAPGAREVIVWDSSLNRFGADTLNGRFKKRFGVDMTPHAWTAWFAVKVLWESSLRMKSARPSKIREYLSRDTTQFDGHKGRPLSFRRWDHQLRQFLYARVNNRLVDVPQNAPQDVTSRQFLDQLGVAADKSKCQLAP